MKSALNHAFLPLIPKIQGASKVAQFRTISLCNITLKIIIKIIAGRLRKHLEQIVHPCQAAFIPDRAISDNIIINHEVMRYIPLLIIILMYVCILMMVQKAESSLSFLHHHQHYSSPFMYVCMLWLVSLIKFRIFETPEIIASILSTNQNEDGLVAYEL